MPRHTEAALREQGGKRDWSAGSSSLSPGDCSTGRSGYQQRARHGRIGGEVWHKTVRASAHMLRAPRAWAMDVSDLDVAERCGVRLIHVLDLEQLRHYWVTPATVRAQGFRFERKHGPQVGLTLDHWAASRKDAESASVPERCTESEPPVVQGRLPW